MTALDFVAAVLAARALGTLWRRGSLTGGARSRAEARGGARGELLRCRVCLTAHLPAYALAFLWLPGAAAAAVLDPAWGLPLKLPLYALAAAGANYLLDELASSRIKSLQHSRRD
jgi:hypothetical protein